jgi:predicted transcriptional regulator
MCADICKARCGIAAALEASANDVITGELSAVGRWIVANRGGPTYWTVKVQKARLRDLDIFILPATKRHHCPRNLGNVAETPSPMLTHAPPFRCYTAPIPRFGATMSDDTPTLLVLTAGIIVSYVEANKIAADDLPALISSIRSSLDSVGEPPAPVVEPTAKATPAQIRKSITPDALISFEDGQSYKTLKRNLSKRGLTPAGYRAKWGLPNDYPMTAPSYSAMRSAMAKSIGLGAKPKAVTKPAPATRSARKPRKVAG